MSWLPLVKAGSGGGGFSFVTHTFANSFANPVSTSAIDTTGATLIVVGIVQNNGFTAGSVSDNKGNTYTGLFANVGGSSTFSQLFYCTSPSVGAGHTFKCDNSSSFIAASISVQVWQGGTGTFDVQNHNTGFGTSLQTGSVTPSVNNSLIVTSINVDGSPSSITQPTSFTMSDSDVVSVEPGGMAYFVQGTAAPINPTWTWASAGSTGTATIATFTP